MKIKTVEDLVDKLYEELAWRKKELIQLTSLIKRKSDTPFNQVLLRSAVAILYAHWEGFIKFAGTTYVSYVTQRRLRYAQLAPNFIALALRKKIEDTSKTTKAVFHMDIVRFFTNELDSNCSINPDESIKTHSNLNSQVLRDIVCYLGLDYSVYESKEKLIDERLLGSRNKIAHGRYEEIDEDGYLELHEEIVNLMETFKTQIENAAVLQSYTKSASTQTAV